MNTTQNLIARRRLALIGIALLGSSAAIPGAMLSGAGAETNTAAAQGTAASGAISILRDGGAPVVEGEVIVKFREPQIIGQGLAKTGISALDKLLEQHGVFAIDQAYPLPARLLGDKGRGLQQIYTMRYNSGEHPRQVALRIAQDPSIEYAVPRYVHRIYGLPQTPSTDGGQDGTAIPDDDLYSSMSHLSLVKAPGAWDVVKGEDGGVIIAIVDGGADWNHEDLLANVWTNLADSTINGIDDDGNGYVDDVHGWNFVRRNGDPSGLTTAPTNAVHGTEVAGIASAVTNNSIGVAGASWNAQLMLVNASCAIDSLICNGIEGIIYAAINGADVINLSWGGAHADLTSFEEGALFQFWGDIADFAAEQGALLVAAAGNDNVNNDVILHMPANAPGYLSVGATNKSSDGKAGFSNYGITVDVFAPGSALNTTVPDNGYTGSAFGTSFSSPLVVGIAALVKTQYPSLTPMQLAQQLRVTADPINSANIGLTGLMGKGRINAQRAVTSNSIPAIRIADISITDSGGDGAIDNGETIDVTVMLTNYLADATDVIVTLIQNDASVTITSSEASIPSLLSGDTRGVTFQFTVGLAGASQALPFVVAINAGSYFDRDLFKLYANEPFVVNHNTGPLQVTITSEGNIGWIGFADESAGSGFIYNQASILFEGGLLVGSGSNRVSDCIRGIDGALEQDFRMPLGEQLLLGPGQYANQEGSVMLVDDLASAPMGLSIHQESFADNDPAYDDFVIFKYTVTNSSSEVLWDLYAGLFFDWDISENGGADYGNFDAVRRMGVMQNAQSSPTLLTATRLLTENGDLSYHAIHNPDEIYFYGTGVSNDGFTSAEKWKFLKGGIQTRSIDNTDISTLTSAGPFVLQPGQSFEVAFAVIAATTRDDLNTHADSAQAFWDRVIPHPQANRAPVFTAVLPAATVIAGDVYTFTYAAQDDDGDELTFALLEGPTGATLDGNTGLFTFQPTIDQVGTFSVRVIVSDSVSSTQTLGNISVSEAAFALSQNYSNPFTPSAETPTTTIEYQLAKQEHVELIVYDLLGREVRKLVNESKPGGRYIAVWDARDNFGRPVSTGLYLYRITAGDFVRFRKMMLLK